MCVCDSLCVFAWLEQPWLFVSFRLTLLGALCIDVVVVVVLVLVVVVGCSSASRHQARVLHLEVNYRQIFD